MYLATIVRGYPTLSHDDLLHGLAESLLSISNLMIVIGAQRKIREYKQEHLGDFKQRGFKLHPHDEKAAHG